MKQLILDIPEQDFDLVVQLLKRFNFKFQEADSEEVPDHVKAILDERLANSDKEKRLTLDQLKKKVKSKYGF
jgi:hypothetical protein